jgi:iron(III) transport system substrate-binding protein
MLRSAMKIGGAILLVALGSSVHAQSNPDWDKIVAAAKREGVVVLYTGLPGNPSTKKIAEAFQAKYGIRIDVLEVRASELREKIRTEFASDRTLGDVSNTSPNQTRQFATEDGTIEKFGALPNMSRLSPDVKAIWEKQTPDVQLPIFNLFYGILVNTRLAPEPPKTFADLLDLKWKGKILADDFRPTGGGHSFHSVTWAAFGNGFHEKLFANQVTFTRDQRESERRVARGEYAIYLPFLLTDYPSLKGLPVKALALAEGVTLTPYAAGLLKHAPHPNAARVLMDFMISDQAQAIYAGEGLMPVVPNMIDKLPDDLRPFGNAKVLGTSLWENEDKTYAAAKEVYKQ